MTRRPLPKSPAYVQYVQGLRRLHALIAEGRDGSPEADAVRDSMDGPWYSLSEAERERIGGLSEDLYSLIDPPAEPLPPNPQATRKLIEASGALHAGEWDRALALLRRWGKYLEPAYLSFMRGTVWQEAGDHANASLFFGHTVALAPQNEKNLAFYLSALNKSEPSAALERAKEVLAEEEAHHPFLVASAGIIILQSTQSMDDATRAPILRGLVEVLRRSIESPPSDGARPDVSGEISKTIYSMLATCSVFLGDTRAALHYYDAGLAIDPDDPALLTSRGAVRYGLDPEGATGDLLRALRNDPRTIWPLVFLAHYNLNLGRFDDCYHMANRALDLLAPDALKARLYEWRAIARSELGFPAKMVRSDFEEAVRLSPEDDEIRHNFGAFQRSGGQTEARPHDWATPRASTIQALYRAEPVPLPTAA